MARTTEKNDAAMDCTGAMGSTASMNRIILGAEVNHDPYSRQGTLQPTEHKQENLEIEHAANVAVQLTFPAPENSHRD